jgi:hypothetical protein
LTDSLFDEVEAKLEGLVTAYRTAELPKASFGSGGLKTAGKRSGLFEKDLRQPA